MWEYFCLNTKHRSLIRAHWLIDFSKDCHAPHDTLSTIVEGKFSECSVIFQLSIAYSIEYVTVELEEFETDVRRKKILIVMVNEFDKQNYALIDSRVYNVQGTTTDMKNRIFIKNWVFLNAIDHLLGPPSPPNSIVTITVIGFYVLDYDTNFNPSPYHNQHLRQSLLRFPKTVDDNENDLASNKRLYFDCQSTNVNLTKFIEYSEKNAGTDEVSVLFLKCSPDDTEAICVNKAYFVSICSEFWKTYRNINTSDSESILLPRTIIGELAND